VDGAWVCRADVGGGGGPTLGVVVVEFLFGKFDDRGGGGDGGDVAVGVSAAVGKVGAGSGGGAAVAIARCGSRRG